MQIRFTKPLILFLFFAAPLFAELPPRYGEALKAYDAGKYEESLEIIRSVFDDYKSSYEFRMLAAADYYHLGNLNSAMAHLDYARKDHPERVDLRLMTAGILRSSGLFTKALEVLKEPGVPVAETRPLQMEEARIHYVRKNYAGAARVAREILAADPNYFDAVVLEGLLFIQEKKWDAAEFRFRHALRLPHRAGRERAMILNNLGFVLEKEAVALPAGEGERSRSMQQKAAEYFDRALQEDSTLKEAEFNRARLKATLS